MKRYEYLVETPTDDGPLTQYLNHLGAEGWLLVTVVFPRPGAPVYTFVREVLGKNVPYFPPQESAKA